MAGRKKRTAFFLGHLEGISWKAFDEYSDVLREMIRGKTGIYALYHNRSLYYVGLASNLMGRLKAHLRDRHDGRWDKFSVYLTADSTYLKELESLVLRIISHSGNAMSGKLTGSKNMHSELNSRIKTVEAKRRAAILGGPVAHRFIKNKARKNKGAVALAGVSDRDIRLVGKYHDERHTAVLKRNGTIRYQGASYTSPTAAARAIVGRAINGWHFWSYKDKQGRWAQLSRIKQ